MNYSCKRGQVLPLDFISEYMRLLVVVLPFVPHTNIIGPLTCEERSLSNPGAILRAMAPGPDEPFLPMSLLANVKNLQAKIAVILRNFFKVISPLLYNYFYYITLKKFFQCVFSFFVNIFATSHVIILCLRQYDLITCKI